MASNPFANEHQLEDVVPEDMRRYQNGELQQDLTLPASSFIASGQTAKYEDCEYRCAKLIATGSKILLSTGPGTKLNVQGNVLHASTVWRMRQHSLSEYATHP
jgi:hypothetical protein